MALRHSIRRVRSAPSPAEGGKDERDRQVRALRAGHPDPLGQPDGGSAGRGAAAAAPGDEGAGGTGRPRAAVPDEPDPAGGLGRARDRDPRAGARRVQTVAADAVVSRSQAGARPRYARAHLLQVRGGVTGRLAQAEHGGRPGLRERRGRDQEADDRDRRRPVGLGAFVRLPSVRARVRGLDGRLELRPEALSALDDGDVGGDRAPLAVRRHRVRPFAARAPDRLARHRDLRGGRGRGSERGHQLLARVGAQPRAPAPDGDRAGGDGADGDGGRGAGRRDRLRRRRVEFRRAGVPVPAPRAARRRDARGSSPPSRRRARR